MTNEQIAKEYSDNDFPRFCFLTQVLKSIDELGAKNEDFILEQGREKDFEEKSK
jgi:hypothetical protein